MSASMDLRETQKVSSYSSPRPAARRLLLALAATAVVFGWFHPTPRASANPIFPDLLVIHVRPEESGGGNPCRDWPVTNCHDVVRSIDREGTVEFDLFACDPYDFHDQIYHVSTLLEWPAAWSLESWAACGGAIGTMVPSGNQMAIDLTWPDCPAWSTGEENLFLIGRILMNVSGYGQIEGPDGYRGKYRCPPDSTPDLYGGVMSAEAGLSCGFNAIVCTGVQFCKPDWLPGVLEVQAHSGETTEAEFTFSTFCPPGDPCQFGMIDYEDWHRSTIVYPGDCNHYRVTVTVDATGLAPGSYEGWAEIRESQATIARCVLIALTVLPALASVPEEGPAGDVMSWGRLKAVYR